MIQTVGTPVLWAGFVAMILVLVTLDLLVFHRRDEVISIRDALGWTVGWIALALCFGGVVWHTFGAVRAAEYLTGFLIEKSLSVDNLFVFIVIFSTLRIPGRYQHRVLFWGILTAVALRAAMILAGTALLQRFHWLLYAFGAFLLLTGVRLLLKGDVEEAHPGQNRFLRAVQRVIPASTTIHGHHFLVLEAGRWVATPLLVALVFIEISDVVFALDSIPAIFGVTLDPFIVFTSNIFAILGLRSLFFAVAGLMDRFSYLETGLSLVLIFIGVKMLVAPWLAVGQWISLAVVAVLLGGSVVVSAIWPRELPGDEPPPGD